MLMAGTHTYSCEDFMFRSIVSVLLLPAAALSLFASPSAWAQTAYSRPDPSDAGVSVPPLVYDSPFARYRAFTEPEVASWRETNDTVGRIGGWRVYAKEAQGPGSGTGTPPAAVKPGSNESAKPVPGGHGGHPMPMGQGGRRE